MQNLISHPNLSTPISDAALIKRSSGKKRGGYSCGRCGLPKKGHICNFTTPNPNTNPNPNPNPNEEEEFQTPARSPAPATQLRRSLTFDGMEVEEEETEKEEEGCLFEVLRRLMPKDLILASGVSREWRETANRIWVAAEELRVRVPHKAPIGFIGSVLQKCTSLVRLSLIMESDVDSMTLACIAFSCPNLESMEILMSGSAVNRITGDELGRFVAERRRLSNLKVEGCSNVGSLVLSSTSLCKLWLSDLHGLSKMLLNCPNLSEISLDFSRLEKDNTDLTTMVGCWGRSCPCLQRVHIASVQLSNSVVLALTAANLRELRMLSLVLGSEITDASVAAIASVYSNLELLDLSGSSITDSGIGMICNVFPETLSRLLLAVCPNITSSGIQFAAAQLPLLELMDCGMTICDPNAEKETTPEPIDSELRRTPNTKLHHIYQKLIIKHGRLKKLSLWGCSGLDALYLNCPQLFELNLNSCSNLHPDSLLLQCPSLESVHAAGCKDMFVDAIQNQVCGNISAMQSNFSSKRLPDGSKRVQAQLFSDQPPDDDAKKRRRVSKQICAVLTK